MGAMLHYPFDVQLSFVAWFLEALDLPPESAAILFSKSS